MPAEPTLPDGSDPAVTRTQIEAGNAAYDAFALAAQAHLNCERAKLRDRQAALQARRDATQAEVEAFNAFATQWQTSSAAFLARQPAPRNNERGN
jgi:ABC-type phosphate transport system auxiliary subunit